MAVLRVSVHVISGLFFVLIATVSMTQCMVELPSLFACYYLLRNLAKSEAFLCVPSFEKF